MKLRPRKKKRRVHGPGELSQKGIALMSADKIARARRRKRFPRATGVRISCQSPRRRSSSWLLSIACLSPQSGLQVQTSRIIFSLAQNVLEPLWPASIEADPALWELRQSCCRRPRQIPVRPPLQTVPMARRLVRQPGRPTEGASRIREKPRRNVY